MFVLPFSLGLTHCNSGKELTIKIVFKGNWYSAIGIFDWELVTCNWH